MNYTQHEAAEILVRFSHYYRTMSPEQVCAKRGISIVEEEVASGGSIYRKKLSVQPDIEPLLRDWIVYHEIGHDILNQEFPRLQDSFGSHSWIETFCEHFALVMTVFKFTKNVEIIKKLTFFNFENPREYDDDFLIRTKVLKRRIKRVAKGVDIADFESGLLQKICNILN